MIIVEFNTTKYHNRNFTLIVEKNKHTNGYVIKWGENKNNLCCSQNDKPHKTLKSAMKEFTNKLKAYQTGKLIIT
jgi:hypothetical protein